VLAGSYIETFGSRSLTRQPSLLVFHPPQEFHAVDFLNNPVIVLNVQLDSKRLSYLSEHSIALDDAATHRSNTIAWLGHKLHHEFRRMDSASALSIEGLVLEILAEASRNKRIVAERKYPEWLKEATDVLRDNFSESLVFEDVARIVGVHPVYLARIFREKNGCTMGEYVRQLRVEYACRQISATKTSLGEIALAAGFADQSHLNKTFKTLFGLTPSQYRRFSRTY
jgi:AraC family transcriptional regulator